jgi:2-oxoglutarate ferredoxin oxidoreductase subunit alpha
VEAVDLGAIPLPPLVERLAAPVGEPYLPFKPAPGKEVPYFRPIGGQGTLVRQTSSTHGEDGYITTDPAAIQTAIDRLERKIEADAERLAIFEADRVDGAETLLITYGVTSRAAKAAVRELRAGGSKVNHLVLKTLWPVPEKLIQAQAQGIKRVVAVEMNTGQFVREVRRVLPGLKVDFFGQMNGQLITPAQIKEVVRG